MNLESGLAAALDARQDLLDTTTWSESLIARPTPCASFDVAELIGMVERPPQRHS